MDPDQPASEEAGRSGSTLYAMQLMICKVWLIYMRVTGFHLLEIASDDNFYLLFGENF